MGNPIDAVVVSVTSGGQSPPPAPPAPPTAKQKRAAYMRDYRRRRKEQEAAAEAAKWTLAPGSIRPVDLSEGFRWIEDNLRVPTGPLQGQKFKLPLWQREFLRDAMQPDIQEAGLSVARKNGKSGLIAVALLCFAIGPWGWPGWRAVITSLTGPLAKELMNAIVGTAKASGIMDQIGPRGSPPPGHILAPDDRRIDFLAADRATGHAVGADLAIIDEAGLLQENMRPLWNALYSSISGRNGKFWTISIQGDGPMFEEQANRAGSAGIHFKKFATPLTADISDQAAWLAGNPGIEDGIKSIDYMRRAAERAVSSPGNESHFRAFDLNQPVDPEREMIVSVSDYGKCIDDSAPPISGDLVVGIDLGGSTSMTCAVAYSRDTGGLICRGAFGDSPKLSERGRKDRMGTLYDRMVKDGELRLYPGRVVPIAEFIRDVLQEFGAMGRIAAIGADRFRRAEAQEAFSAAGIPQFSTHWRGTGASARADGSHDVRAFQDLVLTRKLRMRQSVMLEAAIASSILRFDSGGNPALDKASGNARIDALSAAVIAVGIASLIPDAPLLRVHVA